LIDRLNSKERGVAICGPKRTVVVKRIDTNCALVDKDGADLYWFMMIYGRTAQTVFAIIRLAAAVRSRFVNFIVWLARGGIEPPTRGFSVLIPSFSHLSFYQPLTRLKYKFIFC
jgi:hypothetical protein